VEKPTSVLAPFDDGTQEFLRFVDQACFHQMRTLEREKNTKLLAGEDIEMDLETMGWLNMIRAYGILYNRAIDAGWIKGVHLDEQQ